MQVSALISTPVRPPGGVLATALRGARRVMGAVNASFGQLDPRRPVVRFDG